MEDKYGDKKKCIDFVFAIICRPLNEADQIIIKLFSWTPPPPVFPPPVWWSIAVLWKKTWQNATCSHDNLSLEDKPMERFYNFHPSRFELDIANQQQKLKQSIQRRTWNKDGRELLILYNVRGKRKCFNRFYLRSR